MEGGQAGGLPEATQVVAEVLLDLDPESFTASQIDSTCLVPLSITVCILYYADPFFSL